MNGSAAKPIKLYGNAMPMGKVHANTILVMYYDGTQFNVIGILSQTAAAPTGFVDLALAFRLAVVRHNGASTPYEHGLFSWGNVIGPCQKGAATTSATPYARHQVQLTGNIP